MSWRFRQSFKIAPGVRINLSKSGISTSVGRAGASVNFSSLGTRSTVGLPGTGISYSELHVLNSPPPETTTNGNSKNVGCGCLGLIVALLVLGKCVGSSDSVGQLSANSVEEAKAEVDGNEKSSFVSALDIKRVGEGDEVAVAARSVRGVSKPGGKSSNAITFKQGERLLVKERRGDWAKVVRNGVASWIMVRHLTTRSKRQSLVSQKSPNRVKRTAARKATKRRVSRRASGVVGGNCPCSSRRVCVGPRGGRYCITSGGNKRYGV